MATAKALLNQILADLSHIRLVIQRLTSLGLLSAKPALNPSPSPSFLNPLIPPLLRHLHPPFDSPLSPYQVDFLPSLFLPLPSSTLSSFIDSLLDHVTFRLISTDASLLEPGKPDERIKRATEVLKLIVGPAKIGGEAMEAVLRDLTNGRRTGGMDQVQEHGRARVISTWMAEGGDQGEWRLSFMLILPEVIKTCIEAILDAWSDPKYIKFSLYAPQFGKSASSRP